MEFFTILMVCGGIGGTVGIEGGGGRRRAGGTGRDGGIGNTEGSAGRGETWRPGGTAGTEGTGGVILMALRPSFGSLRQGASYGQASTRTMRSWRRWGEGQQKRER